jgi:hypothetical protein
MTGVRGASGVPRGERRAATRARRAAAAALTLCAAALAAACGGEAGDLMAVERTGSVPGARLELRFTVDGRAACNRGELRQLPSDQVLIAREVERALTGEDDRPGLAERGVNLPAGPGSLLRYRARVPAGTVRFADTSRGQPAAFYRIAKLTRDVAREVCGLPR